jgi:hypothetical protein
MDAKRKTRSQAAKTISKSKSITKSKSPKSRVHSQVAKSIRKSKEERHENWFIVGPTNIVQPITDVMEGLWYVNNYKKAIKKKSFWGAFLTTLGLYNFIHNM